MRTRKQFGGVRLEALEPRQVLSGDFTGDGFADLVWRNLETGQNVVWQMNGTAFGQSVPLPSGTDPAWRIAAIGDLNNDGKPDILWRNLVNGQNTVWLMNGLARTSNVPLPTVRNVNWEMVGVADFSGDGKNDILWRNHNNGDNVLWVMNGTARTQNLTLVNELNRDKEIVALGDFNRDNRTDIVWRNRYTGENRVWFMDGTTRLNDVPLPSVEGRGWQIVDSSDFDRDGNADLAWRNTFTGVNTIWRMIGTARAQTITLPPVADPSWRIGHDRFEVEADENTDWDQDGRPDILWRDIASGANTVWLTGDNGLSVRNNNVPIAANTNTAWVIGAVADFDNDRRPDILWRNSVTGQNAIWLMNGQGRKATVQLPVISLLEWQVAGAADFNGDRWVDILWRRSTNGANVVWEMNNATPIFSQPGGWQMDLPAQPNLNYTVGAVADFDLDGAVDILWRRNDTGENVFWMDMRRVDTGGGVFAYRIGSTVIGRAEADTNWSIGAAADYDSDGDVDILWHNTVTGEVRIWRMNGTNFVSSVALPNANSPNWRVVG